jgi:hypothetical protein
MDDATAIRQCGAGDKEAFRHLVERYQAEAIGHAVTILGNREDAMDAVQDLISCGDSIRGSTSFSVIAATSWPPDGISGRWIALQRWKY